MKRLLCRVGIHKYKSIEIEAGRCGGPYAFLVWHEKYEYCEHCRQPKTELIHMLERSPRTNSRSYP